MDKEHREGTKLRTVIQYLRGAWNWVSVNILVVEGLLLTVVLLADPEGWPGS